MALSRVAGLGAASALSVLILLPSQAAALGAGEIKCRDTVAKGMAKYVKSAFALTRACNKARSAGDVPADTDCNDPVAADTDGKLAARAGQVGAQIEGACASTPSLLSQYPACPAPAAAADDGGATTGIDSFAEVAGCEVALANARVEAASTEGMGNPQEVLSSGAQRCQQAIGSGIAKLVASFQRERRKCQRVADPSLAAPDYVCDSYDASNRIGATRAKLIDSIGKSCLVPSSSLAEMNACGDTAAELQACVPDAGDAAGAPLIRESYELGGTVATTTTTTIAPTTSTEPPTTTTVPPTTTTTMPPTTTTLPAACGDTSPQCDGSCPDGQFCVSSGGGCQCIDPAGACADATIIRTFNAKNGTPNTESALSTGWSGTAHDLDIPDNIVDHVNASCDENCENCAVTLEVRDEPTSNCRCAGDPRTTCNVINGSDAASCGSINPLCYCYFGSPLAISSGGTPVCVVNRIKNDYGGTMNLRTGEWYETTNLTSFVHLGINLTNPCPTCDGDEVQNDGVRDGTCNGGLQNGTTCDTHGDHLTYGPTSFDCPPTPGSNVSGGGLLINLEFSTSELTQPSLLPCDAPMGAMCACRVCTGNATLGCTENADCAAAGAGECTAGGGAGVEPNQCTGYNCGSDGVCLDGPVDKYCDGTTHPDGRGFISCVSDADCVALEAGACTIFDLRRCFSDPITTSGDADIENPLKGAIFCVPATNSPPINSTGGLPGPGTFEIDFDVDVRCQSDPDVVYEFPNGANCPGFGTTTTEGPTTTIAPTTTLPLPPCEDAISPVCGGLCPGTNVCLDSLGVCTCVPI